MTSEDDDFGYDHSEFNDVCEYDYRSNNYYTFGNFSKNYSELKDLSQNKQSQMNGKLKRVSLLITNFYSNEKQQEIDEYDYRDQQENDEEFNDQQEQENQSLDDNEIDMDLGDDIDEFQINQGDDIYYEIYDYEDYDGGSENLNIDEEDQQISTGQIQQMEDQFDDELEEQDNDLNQQQIPTDNQQDLQQNVRLIEHNHYYSDESEESSYYHYRQGLDSSYDSDGTLLNYFDN